MERVFRFLPLTLSVETLGGVSTPLVLRGTPLPAKRSETFTTAADGQQSVEIQVLAGESPIAKNNRKISTTVLGGIPQMPRGKPQIVVTFEVDRACRITARAKETNSGSTIAVTSEEVGDLLTDEVIEHLLQEAEKSSVQDREHLKLIEARNRAQSVVNKAESVLQQRQEKGLPAKQDKEISAALASLGLALDRDNAELIRLEVEKLETLLGMADPFLGLGDLEGYGDIFERFFRGTENVRRQDQPSGKTLRPQVTVDKARIGGVPRSRLGKVFGGGEFNLNPNLCFVLMPFDEDLRPVYEDHIRRVVASEGLACERADEIASTNMITWDIWERINRARLIVADLTRKNPNVFYEVGLAHALGKDVVIVAQSMQDVPFDLRALRCIVYEFTPRGILAFEARLRETIKGVMRSS